MYKMLWENAFKQNLTISKSDFTTLKMQKFLKKSDVASKFETHSIY